MEKDQEDVFIQQKSPASLSSFFNKQKIGQEVGAVGGGLAAAILAGVRTIMSVR